MGCSHDHASSAVLLEGCGGGHDGAGGVDHVVNQQTGATGNVTDEFVRGDLVRNIRVATFVNNR